MKIEDLRTLPAFMQAWPSCRDALMEFLLRRLLSAAATASTETGQQALARLIEELEKLDSLPRPIVKPALPVLNSMKPKP